MSFYIGPRRRLPALAVLAGIACPDQVLAAGEPLVVYSARSYPVGLARC